MVDPVREKDTAVERCDVSVEDGESKTKSRFIVKIMCKHGRCYDLLGIFLATADIQQVFLRPTV